MQNEFNIQSPRAFDIKQAFTSPAARRLVERMERPLEKILSLDALNKIYGAGSGIQDKNFFRAVLEFMQTNYLISREDLQKIPAKGGLVVVANHPFGMIEAIILWDIIGRIRGDVKSMGNYMLYGVPELRNWIFPVDPFGRRSATGSNAKTVKEIIRWVKNGGCLMVFPAGEVAHLHVFKAGVVESPWARQAGALVRMAGANVLPVFIEGRNSWLFQALGLIHPWFRTAMLAREFANKKNRVMTLHVGKIVPWKKLASLDSDAEIVEYLRAKTLFLRNRSCHKRFRLTQVLFPKTKENIRQELISPISAQALEREIAALPPEHLMLTSGEYSVYMAPASSIPNVMMEIGRLREATFREVQEGTGKSFDLDAFDEYYRHLFLFNHKTSEVVGAYRIGLTDEILARHGPEGFYTSTLFKFKPGFLEQLGAALELGRSFIRSEYQKEFNCLSLLWRAIGQFLVRNPKYYMLFGPVSISEDYQVISKNLMVQFLRRYRLDFERSRYVKPRSPFRGGRARAMEKRFLPSMLSDIDEISLLISEIEKDGKGIPILLRHYLKLNAVLLNLNVDRRFSNCLDGLMLVDVTRTDPRILRRFMGDDGIKIFARGRGMNLAPRGPPDTVGAHID